MINYEKAKIDLGKVLRYLLHKYLFTIPKNISKMEVIMDEINDSFDRKDKKYWNDMPYGCIDYIKENTMTLFINTKRLAFDISQSDKPTDALYLDSHIMAQVILTTIHELCHMAIPTNMDLYSSDEEYKLFIERQVEDLADQVLDLNAFEIGKMCDIDPYLIKCVALTSQNFLVFPYLIQRGLPKDFNVCERVDKNGKD